MRVVFCRKGVGSVAITTVVVMFVVVFVGKKSLRTAVAALSVVVVVVLVVLAVLVVRDVRVVSGVAGLVTVTKVVVTSTVAKDVGVAVRLLAVEVLFEKNPPGTLVVNVLFG